LGGIRNVRACDKSQAFCALRFPQTVTFPGE
jgi:hypothetical protein